jgi:hypothetical protein
MKKPELSDYGLTHELALEKSAVARKQYQLHWLIVNALALVVIFGVPIIVPASLADKLIIFAGLLVIFYPLNYIAAVRLLVGFIFKPDPMVRKLVLYNRATIKYQKYLKSVKAVSE